MVVNGRDTTFLSLGYQARWLRDLARLTYCSPEAGEEFLHTPVTWDKVRGKERIIKQYIMQYSKAGKLELPVLYH